MQTLGELARVAAEADLGEKFDRLLNDMALTLCARKSGGALWLPRLEKRPRRTAMRCRRPSSFAFRRHDSSFRLQRFKAHGPHAAVANQALN
jgi:hypothetical protein